VAVTEWQAELERHVRRMHNAAAMASGVRRPNLGQTPRREILAIGTARLYRYESPRTHDTPVLFVPNLGSAAHTSSICSPAPASSST